MSMEPANVIASKKSLLSRGFSPFLLGIIIISSLVQNLVVTLTMKEALK